MGGELKFTLGIDDGQYIGALQRDEQQTQRFADAVAGGSRRASDALRDVGSAAQQAAAGSQRAADAVQGSAAAGQRQAAMAQQFVAALREQVTTMGMTTDQLLRHKAAQLGVSNEADKLITQLHATGKAGQVSAGQTAAAWRQLPMQMQDVAVSLQGGMNPFTVLMQQGPQITSAFGGVKETFVAVRGAITPLMAGMATLATAGAAIAIAYSQGRAESAAFAGALTMSGNAIGLTTGRLGEMARNIDAVAGTQGNAAEVLAALAGQSGITAGGIEHIATAAIKMERAGGPAVEELTKQFADLGKEPLSASLKLNEQTNYLTLSLYEQIRALEEQGRTTEAAALAQGAYASAIEQRAGELEKHLGTLERMWRGIKDAAKETWDAMLDVGREATPEQKLADVEKQIQGLESRRLANAWRGKAGQDEHARVAADLINQRDALQEQITLANRSAVAQAEQARLVKARAAWDKEGLGYLEKSEQRERAIVKARADAAAAGASDAELARRVAAINERYKDTDANAAQAATVALANAQAKAAQQSALDRTEAERAALERRHGMGLMMASDYYTQLREMAAQDSADRLKTLDAEIAAEQARRTRTPAETTQKKAKLVDLQSQRDHEVSQAAMKDAALAGQIESQALAESRRIAQEWAQQMQQAQTQAEQFATQNAQAQAQLITDPLERARAEAEISAQAIERNADRIGVSLRAQIDVLRGSGMQQQADALQSQLDAIQAGAAKAAQNTRAAPDRKILQDYLGADVGFQIADGFDQASQSLSAFVRSFGALIKVQDDYTRAKAAAGADVAKLAAVESKHAQAQVNAYGTMTGAAKSYFAQGSRGYKALDAAEKSFRAVELAMSIKTAMEKIGLITSVTAATVAGHAAEAASATASVAPEVAASMAKGTAAAAVGVANQAQGDPYTALPRMAMMAAAMAALGFATGAFGGGGSDSSSSIATNTGTGTVFGDSSAQSESIANSIDALSDIDTMTMRYSAQMLASLRSIEANIGGAVNLVLRGGTVGTGSNLGIAEGKLANGSSNIVLGAMGDLLGDIPVLGDLIGGLQSLWGSTEREITGSGLRIAGSVSDVSAGRGISQWAGVKTTESSYFGLSKDESFDVTMQTLQGEYARQIGLIFGNFSDVLRSAAAPLGANLDAIDAQISGFVLDTGNIDLRGLSGADMQERLSAVISQQGDTLARSVLPGLDAFTRVGEGYLQTLVRVSSGVEVAASSLKRLGIAAIDFSAVSNKHAQDISAEIVRQSITAAETTYERVRTGFFYRVRREVSSIGDIISTLDGSAADLADAYRALVDIRTTLRAIGIDGEATSRALISGAGSLEALQSGLAAFEKNFMSDAERTALATTRMTDEFARLGQALPTSADAFKALVQGVDTTTEAGRELLGGLLGLSSGYADFLEQTAGKTATSSKSASAAADERAGLEEQLLRLHGDTATLRANELAKLDASNRALQERIWALEDEQKAAAALANAGKGVKAFVDELRGASGADASLAQRRAAYQSDLAAAQGGDAEASSRVVSSARALVDAVKAKAADPLSLARETSRIAAQLQALPAAAAYAAQQAAEQGATTAATPAAQAASPGTPPAVAVPIAAPPQTAPLPVSVPSQGATTQSDLLGELRALRAEVSALRGQVATTGDQQHSDATAIASSVGRTARVLERVTPDGDAISIRVAT